MVDCKICKFKGHDLSSHIRHKHNMNSIQYKELYPGAELQSEYRKNKNKKSSISPFSLDFYISKGYSIDESKHKLESFLLKHSNIMSDKSHFSKSYWISKGYSESEAKNIISKNATRSKSEFISKYGEIEGIVKYEEWCQKIGYKQSVKYLKDINASEETILTHRQSKNNTSLSAFIKRYGEISGTMRYYNYCSIKGVTIDKMIEIYGEYEGRIRYDSWKKSCSHNLKFFIDKYGEHEGNIRYNSWIEKCNTTSHYSMISYELFSALSIDDLKYFGPNEKKIGKYFVDLFYNNKIVEFYGDYWHCHESLFSPGELNLSIGKIASDVWKSDESRIEYIKSFGYPVLIIWEHEYLNNSIEVINRIENFLKGN